MRWLLLCGLAGCAGQGALSLDAGVDAACAAPLVPGPSFGAPAALSDPANASFDPTVAARAGAVLVAWHEFAQGNPRIAYTVINAGCAGPRLTLPEPSIRQLRPRARATSSGWVVAYEALVGNMSVIRSAQLAADGAVVSGPDTVGAPGWSVDVATDGDEIAWAWFDGNQHLFALSGPTESAGPSPVGTTLIDKTLLNFPVIALAADGTLFLAHRDGGTSSSDWEILLATRPKGGVFGPEADVSNSPGLLSDDLSVALEPDGTLDLAWVDQDPVDVTTFEVQYATRSPAGALSQPALYGAQGLWTWTPSVTPGLAAAWRAGQGAAGPLYFGTPTAAPQTIVASAQAGQLAMARGPDGDLHLAFTEPGAVNRVQYSWKH